MEYDGEADVFRASTRNGAKLEFSKPQSKLLELEGALRRMTLSDFIPTKGSASGSRLNGASFPIEDMTDRAS
jgi:hypothetical protein